MDDGYDVYEAPSEFLECLLGLLPAGPRRRVPASAPGSSTLSLFMSTTGLDEGLATLLADAAEGSSGWMAASRMVRRYAATLQALATEAVRLLDAGQQSLRFRYRAALLKLVQDRSLADTLIASLDLAPASSDLWAEARVDVFRSCLELLAAIHRGARLSAAQADALAAKLVKFRFGEHAALAAAFAGLLDFEHLRQQRAGGLSGASARLLTTGLQEHGLPVPRLLWALYLGAAGSGDAAEHPAPHLAMAGQAIDGGALEQLLGAIDAASAAALHHALCAMAGLFDMPASPHFGAFCRCLGATLDAARAAQLWAEQDLVGPLVQACLQRFPASIGYAVPLFAGLCQSPEWARHLRTALGSLETLAVAGSLPPGHRGDTAAAPVDFEVEAYGVQCIVPRGTAGAVGGGLCRWALRCSGWAFLMRTLPGRDERLCVATLGLLAAVLQAGDAGRIEDDTGRIDALFLDSKGTPLGARLAELIALRSLPAACCRAALDCAACWLDAGGRAAPDLGACQRNVEARVSQFKHTADDLAAACAYVRLLAAAGTADVEGATRVVQRCVASPLLDAAGRLGLLDALAGVPALGSLCGALCDELLPGILAAMGSVDICTLHRLLSRVARADPEPVLGALLARSRSDDAATVSFIELLVSAGRPLAVRLPEKKLAFLCRALGQLAGDTLYRLAAAAGPASIAVVRQALQGEGVAERLRAQLAQPAGASARLQLARALRAHLAAPPVFLELAALLGAGMQGAWRLVLEVFGTAAAQQEAACMAALLEVLAGVLVAAPAFDAGGLLEPADRLFACAAAALTSCPADTRVLERLADLMGVVGSAHAPHTDALCSCLAEAAARQLPSVAAMACLARGCQLFRPSASTAALVAMVYTRFDVLAASAGAAMMADEHVFLVSCNFVLLTAAAALPPAAQPGRAALIRMVCAHAAMSPARHVPQALCMFARLLGSATAEVAEATAQFCRFYHLLDPLMAHLAGSPALLPACMLNTVFAEEFALSGHLSRLDTGDPHVLTALTLMAARLGPSQAKLVLHQCSLARAPGLVRVLVASLLASPHDHLESIRHAYDMAAACLARPALDGPAAEDALLTMSLVLLSIPDALRPLFVFSDSAMDTLISRMQGPDYVGALQLAQALRQ